MNKRNVIVVFGGVSSEHDISCISAASILRNTDAEKYQIYPVGITKSGNWMLYESADYDSIENGSWETSGHIVPAVLSPDRQTHGLLVLRANGTERIHADCVFPVLHGIGGEDGTLQGLLELAHIPYVGPGVAASACSMDKSLTKVIVQQEGVRQAAFYLARSFAFREDPEALCIAAEKQLGSYPVFVKPCSEGSSVGVSKATDRASLKRGLEDAFRYDSKVLIEEFIDGQIAPSQEFYSFEAKYVDGTSGLYIPAKISDKAMEQVREAAVRVYRALGCKGLSRVDFFCTYAEDEIVFNEINTLPGFTSISMYPKLQEHMGLPYTKLVDRLISLAMERYDG